jgi:hypothetical protein
VWCFLVHYAVEVDASNSYDTIQRQSKVDTQCIMSRAQEYIRYTAEATREKHTQEKNNAILCHTTITQLASERSKDRDKNTDNYRQEL